MKRMAYTEWLGGCGTRGLLAGWVTTAAIILALGCGTCGAGTVSEPGAEAGQVLAASEVANPPSRDDAPEDDPNERLVAVGDVADRLETFASERELRQYLKRIARAAVRRRDFAVGNYVLSEGVAPSAPAVASAARGESESITNVQEAGVDEGGIVKVHGDHLVILRRGRLFTVRFAGGVLEPIAAVDAYPPNGSPGDWYDELLVSDDTIVVVGYSYRHGATELGIFRIDDGGRIVHRATYFLESNDYYSSRNYASRLIGNRLIFYMPYYMNVYRYAYDTDEEYRLPLPRLGRWRPRGRMPDWSEIVRATEVFRPVQETDNPVLHTVVTCDLASADLVCTARGIIGPYSRTFYVSPRAVYVWVSGEEHWRDDSEPSASVVYRLALENGTIGALRVRGSPIDQFSFKEDEDGYLNVLVSTRGGGDWMWNPEARRGQLAMLRVPVASIDEVVGTALDAAYTRLPAAGRGALQNRFVGDYLIYGSGNLWFRGETQVTSTVHLHPFRGGRTRSLVVDHGIERIEAMGAGAVLIGKGEGGLYFTSLALGATPAIVDRYLAANASQGETRSHGFFFKAENDTDGILGLPMRGGGGAGYHALWRTSAQVAYLRVDDLRFSPLGGLRSRPERGDDLDDDCRVSCVDWYGNTRPIFLARRIFALLGYELVEGQIENGRIVEIRRANFLDALRRHR